MPIQRPSVQGRKSQTTKFVNDIKTKKQGAAGITTAAVQFHGRSL
jgi:hypothetical protein